MTHFRFEPVGSNASTNFHQEDDAKKNSKGEGHAVVFFNGSATPEECNKENDAANNDQEDWGGEELVSQEVKILTVGSLNNPSCHYQEQARQLKKGSKHYYKIKCPGSTHGEEKVEEEESVLDTLHAGLHGGVTGWLLTQARERPARGCQHYCDTCDTCALFALH